VQLIVGAIPPAPQATWNGCVERWNDQARPGSRIYGCRVADDYPVFRVDGRADPALFATDVVHPAPGACRG